MLAVLAASVALSGCIVLNRPPPPPGTYQGWAFDACTAPTVGQMQAWQSSPYRGVGIYIGGTNKGCSQPALNAGWVSTVSNAGWRLAPLYVGLQAPCTWATQVSTIDPNNPGYWGSLSASDAVTQARVLGLGPGTPIYFDMEAYNNADPNCVWVVRQFVTAWVMQLHQYGYVAGYYSSSASGIADEALVVQNPSYAVPDAIWLANWNDRTSVFGDPYFSDAVWSDHQRLHQYHGGHNEGYNGVLLNIDSTIADGPLAG